MTSLVDAVLGRAHLQTQTQTTTNILVAALLAVLDEHQPCEPPRQLLCNGCRHLRPCPTEQAISAALGIKGDP